MTPETEALVRSATEPAAVPFVPEVSLRTAAEPFGLWGRTERDAPPFWAFPWAGGQGLARYVLDHPETVAGRRVLDVASGSGLVAIAADRAGARSVLAGDIDDNALAAMALRFLQAARAAGAAVLAADPARAFVPRAELTVLTTYDVPVLSVLEDIPVKPVTIYQLR